MKFVKRHALTCSNIYILVTWFEVNLEVYLLHIHGYPKKQEETEAEVEAEAKAEAEAEEEEEKEE